MIFLIQKALKDILAGSGFPEQNILLSLSEENQLQPLPCAVILPETARFYPLWQREPRGRCSYRVELPFRCSLRGRTAEEVSVQSEDFLSEIPRRLLVKGRVVQIEIISLEAEEGQGALDEHRLHISLKTFYGLSQGEKGAGVIPAIDLILKKEQ